MSSPSGILHAHCKSDASLVEEPCWQAFLERFAKTKQKVSFLPSMGRDLRGLLFQAKDRLEVRLGATKGQILPADLTEYQTPDLWLFCEASVEMRAFWADSTVLHSDLRTRIVVTRRSNVVLTTQQCLSDKAESRSSQDTLAGIYLEVEITSDVASPCRADVLFVQATSLELLGGFILPNEFPLSHCVVMGEEAVADGSSRSLTYLWNLWGTLKTEWMILNSSVYNGSRKRTLKLQSMLSRYWTRFPRGLTCWPEEHGWIRWGQGHAIALRYIENRFCAPNVPLAALTGGDGYMPEGLYLHFCCEGWKSLGPVTSVGVAESGKVLLDGMGLRIATYSHHGWTVHAPNYGLGGWETPIITSGPKHPHPSSGGHPRYGSRQYPTHTHDDPN